MTNGCPQCKLPALRPDMAMRTYAGPILTVTLYRCRRCGALRREVTPSEAKGERR